MNSKRFFLVLSILAIIILLVVSVMFFFEYKGKDIQKTYGSKSLRVTSNKFPPIPSRCPDYWETVGPNACENVKRIGKCNTSTGNTKMDFDKFDQFKGEKGPVNKCNWAKGCQVSWEGIQELC